MALPKNTKNAMVAASGKYLRATCSPTISLANEIMPEIINSNTFCMPLGTTCILCVAYRARISRITATSSV